MEVGSQSCVKAVLVPKNNDVTWGSEEQQEVLGFCLIFSERSIQCEVISILRRQKQEKRATQNISTTEGKDEELQI